MAVLHCNIYGVLKMLWVCVVLLVASIPIAMHVVLAFIKDFSLASEWTQNAKDVFDTMLFQCKQEVEADLDSHTSLLLAFRSCCRDDGIHCCGLLSQSCGDQGGCGCASVVAC